MTALCTCKTQYGRVHHRRLQKLHNLFVVRAKEAATITVKRRDHEDNGLFVEVAHLDTAWRLAQVRDRGQFGQVVAEREYVQLFELPECALTLDDALIVAVIEHGEWRYSVKLGKEPQGVDQYYSFAVLERERIKPCD